MLLQTPSANHHTISKNPRSTRIISLSGLMAEARQTDAAGDLGCGHGSEEAAATWRESRERHRASRHVRRREPTTNTDVRLAAARRSRRRAYVRPPTQRVASPKAPERRQAEGNEAGTQHKNPALGAGLAFGQETRRIFMTLFFGLCIIRR